MVKTTHQTPERANAPHREGELLVRFRAGVTKHDKEMIIATLGARKKKDLQGESGIEKLELLVGGDVRAVAVQMLLNTQVEFAEPNFLISKDDITPNDEHFNQQWALRNTGQNSGQFGSDINASGAWDTTTGSSSTVIAVIDSGIDFTHPDLANNQWINPAPSANGDLHGWDYVTNNAQIKDEQGHGTAVAGIIAAEGNNSFGVTGVMWRAGLMSLRVLDNTGTGDIANAIEAIDYAVTHGAQVINLSWGTSGDSVALKDAIQRAIRRNVVVVCSAGNGSRDLTVSPYYPASFGLKDLITVAASDNFDRLTSWSNWGTGSVTVAAPGTNILTTEMGGLPGGHWDVRFGAASRWDGRFAEDGAARRKRTDDCPCDLRWSTSDCVTQRKSLQWRNRQRYRSTRKATRIIKSVARVSNSRTWQRWQFLGYSAAAHHRRARNRPAECGPTPECQAARTKGESADRIQLNLRRLRSPGRWWRRHQLSDGRPELFDRPSPAR